ncbi:copper resistance D family protein [Williamsia sp.]|uniref:copper resistance D family protein n=1 Tax=Williamsia sp. TaxID=1872085 RepID=UPI002F93A4CE
MTAGTARREWLLGAVPAACIGVLLTWLLARPAGPDPGAVANAIALVSGMTVLGLAGLRLLGSDPVTPGALRLTAVGAGVWTISALIASWLHAAERVGQSPATIGIRDFVNAGGTTPAIVSAGCGLGICIAALVWIQRPTLVAPEAAAAVAALGLVVEPITGHLRQQTGGAIVLAIHVLAASWWCGALIALALTARGRKAWAVGLPRFSRQAQWCVLALVLSGVVAAVLELDSIDSLWTTGYGRILIAKSIGLVILLASAFYLRNRWLPAAANHRFPETSSLRFAIAEVLVMAVVIGLAAGLGATAPN